MAGTATTALSRAFTGEGEPPKKNPNVVSKAVFNKLQEAFDRKEGKLAKMAKQGKEAGSAVLHVLETGGTALVYGAVKGGFGDENTSIGDVPVGGVVGVGFIGWGLYDVISGDGGEHQLAIGTGLLASDLSDLGRKAGAAAREKWQDKKDGLPTDAKTPPPAVDTKAPATVTLAGGVRELEVGRSGRRRRDDDDDTNNESWWRKQGRKRGRSGDSTHSIAPIRVLTMSGDDDDDDGDFDD